VTEGSNEGEYRMSTEPNQADVDALRGLLDLMANFESNDQRARYLLSSNWMRDRDAALTAPRPMLPVCANCGGDEFACGACGARVEADSAPRPVVDREAVRGLLKRFHAAPASQSYDRRDLKQFRDDLTDAVLALINGSTS
jgi:hypothetical protein